jgi:hypothetical protein
MRFSIPLLLATLCTGPSLYAAPSLLDDGYRQMYNLQFAEAHRSFQQWQRLHPEDAMGAVSDAAAYLFSEFDRLHILQSEFFTDDDRFMKGHKPAPDPELKKKFEGALASARALAAQTPATENSRLAAILAYGLHSDYLALVEKSYGAALQETKTSRSLAESLLVSNPECYDAWVAVGVENYLLSLKPAPVRWFLKLGGAQADREKGIAKLRLAAEKGRYLAPFARLMLAVAALRDGNRPHARELLAGLSREFPRNPLYAQELERLGAAD